MDPEGLALALLFLIAFMGADAFWNDDDARR